MNRILALLVMSMLPLSSYAISKPAADAGTLNPDAIFLDENGRDSRQPMTNPASPWSAIGRISRDNHDGTVSSCTGTLVGRSIMVTNAHCVLNHGRISGITFQPLYVNGSYAATADSEWITVGTLDPDNDWRDDWAVVKLDHPLGDRQGWLGVSTLDSYQLPVKVQYAGYSDNFADTEVAGADSCSIRTRFDDGTFGHNCSSGPGGSGGPLFVTNAQGSYIVALNSRGVSGGVYKTYSPANANIAVMTAQLLATVKQYRQKYD